MKLRLRSLETKETVRVEVPPQCSLQLLKQTLSQKLSAPPESIRLSLNKVDEIQSSSPEEEDTLQSLGIASGDLIFYRTGGEDRVVEPVPEPMPVEVVKIDFKSLFSDQNPQINPSLMEAESSKEMEIAGSASSSEIAETANSSEEMDIDDGEEEYATAEEDSGKGFSVPGFLRRVFKEELVGDNGGGQKHRLLKIAVHAVLLESGFIAFDLQTQTVVSCVGNMSPENYTLPGKSISKNGPFVKLKFVSMGQSLMKVYGFLSSGSAMHSVYLKEEELVSFFNVVWANCGEKDQIVTANGVLSTTPEKEVFKFWRSVKDSLALPLMIDLCEKLGLGLPPCFARLPTDLKLVILKHLPGVDVAKVSCVSSEMRYLGSDDDVWKKKCEEQFGAGNDKLGPHDSWKKRFAKSWQKRQKRFVTIEFVPRSQHRPLYAPRRRPPMIFYHRDRANAQPTLY